MGMSVSCLYIVDTLVGNPCDGLDGSSCVIFVKLIVDEGGGITIILFDGVA